MICPCCKQHNLAQPNKLLRHDLAIKITCSNCCRKSLATNWTCNCGVMWHICPRHGQQNPPRMRTHKADDILNAIASKASKRPPLTATIGQILDDLKRESQIAKKHPCDDIIDLGYMAPASRELKLGMIPVKLRERSHLATSNSD